MQLLSRKQPFHRVSVIWTTIAISAVVLLFLAVAGVYTPNIASQFGALRLAALIVSITLIGFGIHWAHIRSLERRVLHPLQRVADITQAIVDGAVSGQIDLDKDTVQDVVRVSEAVNRLSQKATRDVSEMKRLERVRSEFIGNVSHELRTPIFSVQGYLETLLDGAVDDANVSRQFLEKAYQNALRLNALLSDLIDISRIESGELRLSFRYFDIVDVLKDVVQTMEIRRLQKNVHITIDIDPDRDLTVYGDKERLTQVMTNLIDNAIKYNVEKGTVTVKAIRHDGHVRISVSDNGIGIAREHHPRVFERFYRVDRDRSRAVGGTGLGLAIVKHILEAHQAPLTLHSEQGSGTTISFDLKAAT
jgi:two-component system phosphate regulon sensor histidine kinase PhoR